jgi:hypothetical protein
LDGQHPPKGGGSGGGNFPTERHRSASSGHGPGHGGHSADGHAASGHEEVEVGQSFARPDGLLPCQCGVGVRVGGIKPFLGTKPARFNLDGSARADPAACAPVVAAADRMMAALQKSRGDEAYCLVRARRLFALPFSVCLSVFAFFSFFCALAHTCPHMPMRRPVEAPLSR